MLADKKKLMIIGALAVVVLGIGVFQFTGGGSPAPAPQTKKVVMNTTGSKGSKSTVNPGAMQNAKDALPPDPRGPEQEAAQRVTETGPPQSALPERDPFDGTKYMPVDEKSKPAQTPTPPPTTKPIKATSFTKPPDVGPVQVGVRSDGTFGAGSGLPAPKPEDTFAYSVSGAVTGDRPAAVFQDKQGNQRLITLGSSLDPDTQVVAIQREKVTVKYHGKNITLTVGANNPTEKRSDEK